MTCPVGPTCFRTSAMNSSAYCHNPILLCLGDVDDEIFENALAEGEVCHFWVELQAPHLGGEVFYGDEVSVGRSGHRPEALRDLVQLVPMRHPHDELLGQSLEERRPAALHARHVRLAVLALQAGSHLAPEDVG